jgi:hypothetical protein
MAQPDSRHPVKGHRHLHHMVIERHVAAQPATKQTPGLHHAPANLIIYNRLCHCDKYVHALLPYAYAEAAAESCMQASTGEAEAPVLALRTN